MRNQEVLISLPEVESQPITFSLGITGEVHGAGSTTTAKLLAEVLDFDYEYAGDYRRRLAIKAGCAEDFEDNVGVARFDEEIASRHPQTDSRLDRKIITKALGGSCVFEGKAAVVLAKAGVCPTRDSENRKNWLLSPIESAKPIFTVLLNCDEKTAAQRLLLRKELYKQEKDLLTVSTEERQEVIDQLDKEEIEKQIQVSRNRMQANHQNWDTLYNFSHLERSGGAYDLKIDTTNVTPEQVVCQIITALRRESIISKEAERKALVEILTRVEEPHDLVVFFDQLDRKEAIEWSNLFIDKLHQNPELFRGSQWLIKALHVLSGPLPELPAELSSTDVRGCFRSERLSTHYLVLGIEVFPTYKDIPYIMENFCRQLDSVMETVNSPEINMEDRESLKLDVACCSYVLMALIHPFSDGTGRVIRSLCRYILGPEQKITFPLDLNFKISEDSPFVTALRELAFSFHKECREFAKNYDEYLLSKKEKLLGIITRGEGGFYVHISPEEYFKKGEKESGKAYFYDTIRVCVSEKKRFCFPFFFNWDGYFIEYLDIRKEIERFTTGNS